MPEAEEPIRIVKTLQDALFLLEGFLMSVGLLDPEMQETRTFEDRVEVAYTLLLANVPEDMFRLRPEGIPKGLYQ